MLEIILVHIILVNKLHNPGMKIIINSSGLSDVHLKTTNNGTRQINGIYTYRNIVSINVCLR